MDYTPRQVMAYLVISRMRRREDLSEQLVVGLLAARGEEKAVRAKLKELTDAG